MFKSLHRQHIQKFLNRLEQLDQSKLPDAFCQEVAENVGYYTPPEITQGGSHMVEINLYQVSGRGLSAEEAIHCWIKAAKKQIKTVAM